MGDDDDAKVWLRLRSGGHTALSTTTTMTPPGTMSFELSFPGAASHVVSKLTTAAVEAVGRPGGRWLLADHGDPSRSRGRIYGGFGSRRGTGLENRGTG
jgi:hypothetical protein